MFDVKKVCRACLGRQDVFTYNLFENVSPEEYQYCTSVEVREDDLLPNTLCSDCHECLTKFSQFKKMCIHSERTLMTSINSLSNPLSQLQRNQKSTVVDVDYNQDDFVQISVKTEYSDDEDYCDNSTVVEADNSQDHFIQESILIKNEHNDNAGSKIDRKCEITKKTLGHMRLKKLSKLKRKLTKPVVKLKSNIKHFTFSCETCNKKFSYLERFEAHKLEHEGKVVAINCTHCKKTFMTWSGLKRHTETDHMTLSLKSLRCSLCGKICKSRQTLQMHRKLHGDRTKWVCDICGKCCSTRYILKIHQETHKENRERLFTCEHCGKKFFTNMMLKSHVRKIHKGQYYICEECNYPFKCKHNLAKHLLLHEGKKLYKCDICNKSFGAQSSLVEHKRIHSGERPYGCIYCPKRFSSKRRLTDHHRIHTGERPYKCSICEQGFTQRGTMKRHMRVHVK